MNNNVSITSIDETEKPKSESKSSKQKNKTLIVMLMIVISLIFIISIIVLVTYSKLFSKSEIEKNNCNYNDKTYLNGESFNSIDGCNKCSCNGAIGEVVCTEMSCERDDLSNEEEKINPEDNSSTNSDETVDEHWSTYTSTIFNYSIRYPETMKINTPEECQANTTHDGPCNAMTLNFEGMNYPDGTISLESSEIYDYSLELNSIKNYGWRNGYTENTYEIDGIQANAIEGLIPMTPDGLESNDSYAMYIFVNTDKYTHRIFIWDNKQRINQETIETILNSLAFD